MKKIISLVIISQWISLSIFAQKGTDFRTTGNENYCIINISRSITYQEVRAAHKLAQMVYINNKPILELACPGRASVKEFSEGKIKLFIKYLPNKKIKQKNIDKQFLSGDTLTLTVKKGNTYFVNVDTKVREGAILVIFSVKLVSIPESEAMFTEEERFKSSPEVKVYEDVPTGH